MLALSTLAAMHVLLHTSPASCPTTFLFEPSSRAACLGLLSKLTRLLFSLNDNLLGPMGATTICKAIANTPHLQSIKSVAIDSASAMLTSCLRASMSNCGLKDEGAQAVTQALRDNTTVTHLQ